MWVNRRGKIVGDENYTTYRCLTYILLIRGLNLINGCFRSLYVFSTAIYSFRYLPCEEKRWKWKTRSTLYTIYTRTGTRCALSKPSIPKLTNRVDKNSLAPGWGDGGKSISQISAFNKLMENWQTFTTTKGSFYKLKSIELRKKFAPVVSWCINVLFICLVFFPRIQIVVLGQTPRNWLAFRFNKKHTLNANLRSLCE